MRRIGMDTHPATIRSSRAKSDHWRPNLFLVGAMKCGTTSLHNYLAEHPQIFMTKDPWKEPAYFVDRLNWSKEIGRAHV